MIVNCCLMVSLFLGGWTLSINGYGLTTSVLRSWGLAGGILGALIFITKMMFFLLAYVWFRATFPRFRFDQLMDLGWKWMIPLALANIAVTALVVLAGQSLNFPGEVVLSIAGAAIIAFTLYLLLRPRTKVIHARRVSEA
jgi:NADH-quinone oxidoreductase subunit H